MTLTARIEPVQVADRVAIQLSAYVRYYDLVAKECSLFWFLADETGARIGEGANWDVPTESVQNWGSDDHLILEILAAYKNFTIINFIGAGPINLT